MTGGEFAVLVAAGGIGAAFRFLVGSFVACVAAAGVGGMLGGLVPLG